MASHYIQAICVLFLSCALALAQTTSPFENCFYLQGSVCVNSQQGIVGQDNKVENLVGIWTFNDKFAADHSGFKNFMDPPPKAGPASGGRGYSAFFNGSDMSTIKHIPAYDTKEFTLSFWVFLLKGNMDGWRTLVYKGSSSQEMTPSILLWPGDTRLHVRVSTDKLWNEGLDSTGSIPLRKWVHVAVSYSDQLLQLYLNGMLDSQTILQGSLRVNNGPFYIGKDPYHAGTACYIDHLKFYAGKLKGSFLMAEVFTPLAVVEAKHYSIVGCESCNYNEAQNSCPEEYHLCSLPELYSGGYHTARSLGWFRNNKDVWFRVTNETQSQRTEEDILDPNVFKLGLCCVI